MAIELGAWTLALNGASLPEKSLIGGKAWSIARLRAFDLPVPPAFVITVKACNAYLRDGVIPATLDAEIRAGMAWIEAQAARQFGGSAKPLLVSVRSGAMISMPGMMDTVLNLGINNATAAALAAEAADPEFARDTHRRFLDLYARIVLRATLPELASTAAIDDWQRAIFEATDQRVPEDPYAQLWGAIHAVFESWNSRRARRYREHHGIAHDLGTAVTVQAMVFGNLDDRSGTGVLFSRNPLTGDPAPYGEYLARAQGEDVVSGRFTPQPLAALASAMPDLHAQLLAAAVTLERENGDVQDIEFTIQHAELYLLQTRAAKRAPAAAVRFACDMVHEGRIDRATALSRLSAEQVRVLLSPRLASGVTARAVAQGEAACQGVGVGVVVMSSDEAERRAQAGEAVVLARETTSPDDVHGMLVARAVITEQGGATSHAAVVSRALGVPCVVGCGVGSLAALTGTMVTVDGASGQIYAGNLPVLAPNERDDPALCELLRWAERVCPITVLDETAPVAEVYDLDVVKGGEDATQLATLLAGRKIAKGGAITSDEGVRAALQAGVTTIVARHRLPVMLAAIAATRGD
ncbi:MAG: pyruvate, phosphate dikinase [Gammaproteobacteria bacterium]|nr:pyruvate, phosphate dikinase [Gammaproteobacteria bacterium]